MHGRKRRANILLAALLCAIATSTTSARARADDKTLDESEARPPILGEVLVLLASDKEGQIDPSLAKMRALKHPPFSGFKSIKVLSRSALYLLPDRVVQVDLPNGRKLHLTLVAQLKDGRTKVEVSINRPHKRDYLPLLDVITSPGEPFFVAGQKFGGGTLVIGVRVGEPSHAKHHR